MGNLRGQGFGRIWVGYRENVGRIWGGCRESERRVYSGCVAGMGVGGRGRWFRGKGEETEVATVSRAAHTMASCDTIAMWLVCGEREILGR